MFFAGLQAGSEPVRLQNPDPENPGGAGGAHQMMWDGDELMVLRVPNLPPVPSARTDRRTRVDGTMQCTEAGVAIALRRRVERTRTLHERKESCQKW